MRTLRIVLALLASLWASSVQASTFYVATTGSDLNSCATAQTITTPKASISAGVACASAGDNVFIRVGLYEFAINTIRSGFTTVNGGTDFGAGAINIGAYCPAGVCETVTIRPGGGFGGAIIELTTSAQQYIIFDHLILHGTGEGGEGGGFYANQFPAHIRFQNGEIKNTPFQGVLSGASDLELLNNHIHNNGTFDSTPVQTHNIYITGSDSLVSGNEIDHGGSNGVQVYSATLEPSRNLIQGNFIHDNGRSGASISGGTLNALVNNIFSSTDVPGQYGAYVEFATPANTLIYNNTFAHANAIHVGSDASGTLITNNILRTAANAGPGTIEDLGSGTIQTTNSTANPTFTNGGGSYALASDFNIQSTSIMRDTGTALASVLVDYIGTTRPQNLIWDIGAYEFIVSTPGGLCPGGSIFSIVAHTAKGSTDTYTVTTDPIDTTTACLITLALADDQFGSSTLTDSFSNTWNARTPYTITNQERIRFYDCYPCIVGQNHTFTATTVDPSVRAFPSIAVAGVAGTTLSPFDQINGDTTTGVSLATGSVTPSQAIEVLFAALAYDFNGNPTINTGFTVLDSLDTGPSGGSYYGVGLAYLQQSTLTARNPTWLVSTSSGLAASIATYKLVTPETPLYRLRRAIP